MFGIDGKAQRGLVNAPQPEASWEGARVLSDGGNAADALVTAALVQGICDPHRCGIGGFGCATLCLHDRAESSSDGKPQSLAIDFHGRVGSRGHPELWTDDFEAETPDGFGYLVRDRVNDVGYASITVPGMLAGLGEIHDRFGSLPWRDLVLRSVPHAEDGFRVSDELAKFWRRPGLHGRVSTRDRLGLTQDGRRICFDAKGEPPRTGDVFRQPLLAKTYRRLADAGWRSFYEGEIADEIARDWEARGALVDAGDLASYRPTIREPIECTLGDCRVLSTPLPGGGVALLQSIELALREHARRPLVPHSADTIHRLGQILQAVWSDRLNHQGDPAFGTPDEESFLEDSYLDRLIEDTRRPPNRGADCSDTTQLTIVDEEGGAISFSHSLGYNSGVFSPGLGVLFNNCMSAFDPRPGSANSIEAGKARSTAVAETIVLRDRAPWLVLGSPGAARITAGLMQVILGVTVFGRDIAEAVVEPRFDAYGPGTMLLDARHPLPVVRELASRGWDIIHSPNPYGVVGRVYAAQIASRQPLKVSAGVDPGAPGAAHRPSVEAEDAGAD